MGEFVAAALGFPAALFSAALIVIVGFWLLVLDRGAPPHTVGGAPHRGPAGGRARGGPGGGGARVGALA
ncbi:hypothetical protein ACFXC2_15040, partial [Streptomyces lavendulae]